MGGFTPGARAATLLRTRHTAACTPGPGLGADDMLVTSAGLWIASDNFTARECGGVPGHAGICFLPY